WNGTGCKTFSSETCSPSTVTICPCVVSPGTSCDDAGYLPFPTTIFGIPISNGDDHWWVVDFPIAGSYCVRVTDVSGVLVSVEVMHGGCVSPIVECFDNPDMCCNVSTSGEEAWRIHLSGVSGSSGTYTISVASCAMC